MGVRSRLRALRILYPRYSEGLCHDEVAASPRIFEDFGCYERFGRGFAIAGGYAPTGCGCLVIGGGPVAILGSRVGYGGRAEQDSDV